MIGVHQDDMRQTLAVSSTRERAAIALYVYVTGSHVEWFDLAVTKQVMWLDLVEEIKLDAVRGTRIKELLDKMRK